MKPNSKEIIKIAQNVFKSKKISINSNIKNTLTWDSINHVSLVAKIEKKFKLKISFEDSISIFSIKDLIKILSKS